MVVFEVVFEEALLAKCLFAVGEVAADWIVVLVESACISVQRILIYETKR